MLNQSNKYCTHPIHHHRAYCRLRTTHFHTDTVSNKPWIEYRGRRNVTTAKDVILLGDYYIHHSTIAANIRRYRKRVNEQFKSNAAINDQKPISLMRAFQNEKK